MAMSITRRLLQIEKNIHIYGIVTNITAYQANAMVEPIFWIKMFATYLSFITTSALHLNFTYLILVS